MAKRQSAGFVPASRSAKSPRRRSVQASAKRSVTIGDGPTGMAMDAFAAGLDEIGFGSTKCRNPFESITAVFSGLGLISDMLARVPFENWEDGAPLPYGPVVELFRRPNPLDDWPTFLTRTVISYHSGNAYIRLGQRDSWGLPSMLDPIPPSWVEPIKDDRFGPNYLKAYKVSLPNGAIKMVLPEDMLHLQHSPTDDRFVGIGPFQPGSVTLDTELMAGLYQKNTLSHGGSPGSILSYKGQARIKRQDRTRIENEWMRKFGSAVRAARVALLTGDWSYQNLGFSPRDMQYMLLRGWNKKEVALMLKLAPILLGDYEQTGFSDAGVHTAYVMSYELCFIPLASKLASAFNEKIVHPAFPSQDVIFNFDSVEALREDLGKKLEAAERLTKQGVPFAEANRLLDIGVDCEQYPWLYESLVQSGQTTARAIVLQASLPPELPPEIDPVTGLPLPPKPGAKALPPPGGGEPSAAEQAQQAEADRLAEEEKNRKLTIASHIERGKELTSLSINGGPSGESSGGQGYDSFGKPGGGPGQRALRGKPTEIAGLALRAARKPIVSPEARAALVQRLAKAGSPILRSMEKRTRDVMALQKKAVRNKLLEIAKKGQGVGPVVETTAGTGRRSL